MFAQVNPDSLLSVVEEKPPKEQCEIYIQLASIYFYRNTDKAEEFARKALQIAKDENYKKGIADGNSNLGITKIIKGNAAEAIANFESAEVLYRELKLDELLARNYSNLAIAKSEIGSDDDALENFLKSLEILEKTENYSQISGTQYNIGHLYYRKSNMERARKYFNAALESAQKDNNLRSIANAYSGIGRVNIHNKNFVDAENDYTRVLQIRKKMQDSLQITYTYIELAGLKRRQKEFEKALNYTDSALTVAEKMGAEIQKGDILFERGRIFYDTEQYPDAISSFKEALIIAEETDNLRTITDNLGYISKTYEIMGDSGLALRFLNDFIIANDSLNNMDARNEINRLEMVYESRKKQQEIVSLKTSNKIEQRWRTILILVIVLLVITIILVARLYLVKKKNEEEILRISEELRIQNASKDKFFSIIAHDLKSPFTALLGYSEFLANDYDDLTDEEKREYSNSIHKVSRSMNNLLENLLEWSRIQTDRINIEPEVFDIFKTVHDVIELHSQNAEKKNIRLENRIEKNTLIFADQNAINTVLRNLVSNAIKFTECNGSVKVYSQLTESNCVKITVEDNGIGMKEEEVEKLFKIDNSHTTLGTSEEKGTGLGLILSKDLIEKNNGTLEVESSPSGGSKFSFSLPILSQD